MAWSHNDSPGAPALLQAVPYVGNTSLATNLATHVSSATLTGNSVSGIIKLITDGSAPAAGDYCRIPFPDLVATAASTAATYAVTLTKNDTTADSTAGTMYAYVGAASSVPSLRLGSTTALNSGITCTYSYHIERVD